MALVVEDGTGFPDAESPNSAAEVVAYFATIGTAAQTARLARSVAVAGNASGWVVASGGPGYATGASTLALGGSSPTGAFAVGDMVLIGADPNPYETVRFAAGILTILAPGLLVPTTDGATVTAVANFAELERACRRATRKQEAMYRGRVRGYPRRPGVQSLSFPRATFPLYSTGSASSAWSLLDPNGGDYLIVDPKSVPPRWKEAHAELALLALDEDLEPSITKENYLTETIVAGTRSDKTSHSTTKIFKPTAQVEKTFIAVNAMVKPLLYAPGRVTRA